MCIDEKVQPNHYLKTFQPYFNGFRMNFYEFFFMIFKFIEMRAHRIFMKISGPLKFSFSTHTWNNKFRNLKQIFLYISITDF